MSEPYPFFPFKTIQLSRIQYRLAVELAMETAGAVELKRQIEAQLEANFGYHRDVEIDEKAVANIEFNNYPEFTLHGFDVEWID